MYVETLKLTNMRGIDAATLRFQPGFNLVVGVNGVGKTTVLDALSSALSHVVRQVNGLRTAVREPSPLDIRFGADGLTIECSVSIEGASYDWLLHQPSLDPAVSHRSEGKPREQTHHLSARREFIGREPGRVGAEPSAGRPLAVLFSTRRATAARAEARQKRAVGGVAAAFAEALEDREFRLGDLADWMRAQAALAEERPQSLRILEALEAAARRFLPGYRNLRPVEDERASLWRTAAAVAGAAVDAAMGNTAAVLEAALLAADFAAPAAGRSSRSSLLVLDRGEVELVPLDRLSDADRALVRLAVERAEDWLALHWTGDGLDERATPAALDEDRRRARATRIADELQRLLPTCRNLQSGPDGDPDGRIEVLPTTVPVTQLSDGERGALAMVLDLTRRLAQANPHLDDPAAQAEAIVLIDEIDLHLHPRWQRDIIASLTAVFPRCQFIATTHSPQVISEVPHDRIQIMNPKVRPDGVYRPEHSFGIDASRVLEELMDVSPRPTVIQEQLRRIAELARPDSLAEARAELADLAGKLGLGTSDPDVVRLATLLEFVEDV
jgi:hypothetical protein